MRSYTSLPFNLLFYTEKNMKKSFIMLVLFVMLHSPLTIKPVTNNSKLKQAAYIKLYQATEKYKAKKKAFRAIPEQRDQQRARQKDYRATKKGKDNQKAYEANRATDERKTYQKTYQKDYRAKKSIEREQKLTATSLISSDSIEDYDRFEFNYDGIEDFGLGLGDDIG